MSRLLGLQDDDPGIVAGRSESVSLCLPIIECRIVEFAQVEVPKSPQLHSLFRNGIRPSHRTAARKMATQHEREAIFLLRMARVRFNGLRVLARRFRIGYLPSLFAEAS